MTGPDGQHDEPWAAGAGSGSGAAASEEPVDQGEGASRLALDDDDPPLPWLQGDDEDEEFVGAGLGQTMAFIALGLIAIALIVGGIWWVTNRPDEQALVADGSTIKAPAEPYKQPPTDPGGKVFAGTGDTSFSISEGQRRPARLGQGEEAVPSPAPSSSSAPAATGSPAPAAAGGVGVQVAAYSNQEQAEAGWARLQQQYSALASVKHRIVQGQADIGTVYRLQAVAADAAQARSLCQQLKAAGLNCQVKN